jgi:hypothetical protein
MIVGMAVSMILNTEPYVVVNSIFRKKHLTNFFLRKMNVVWIMGNDVLGNYPALDVGATYKGMPPPGRRIAAVFGHPMEVNRHTERTGLTRAVERSVRELMTAYVSLFGACFLFAYIYAHC